MKPVSIHPLSALAGAGLLGLILVASGAAQSPMPLQQLPTGQVGLVRVAGIPDPRLMLVIRDGTPLVVPAGKLLVITGLGATGFGTSVSLSIDGTLEVTTPLPQGTAYSATVLQLPPGLTAAAGSTVHVTSSQPGGGRAWGYLADA